MHDKNTSKKFSGENNMIPSQEPKEVQGLTQSEEMLIAHAFPVIPVFTKLGGQRAYIATALTFPKILKSQL